MRNKSTPLYTAHMYELCVHVCVCLLVYTTTDADADDIDISDESILNSSLASEWLLLVVVVAVII